MATDHAPPPATDATPQASPPAIPDYISSPNAVFTDEGVHWRDGRAPDYTKTRKACAEGRRTHHAPGSLADMVENLVKNWEVEASFKTRLRDWRTINRERYSFAMGSGERMSAEHMIEVGTYNGIIAANEYYSPANSDFASSHKTFKRMMPTFAWEVLEVYSGPPRVAFRWRHWGQMKNDYVGCNEKGEKVTARAHGGVIDIGGVTVATVDEQLRLEEVRTWMDPLEMFRQIAPGGIVDKQAVDRKMELEAAPDVVVEVDGEFLAQEHNQSMGKRKRDPLPEDVIPEHVLESIGNPVDSLVPCQSMDAQQPTFPTHASANNASAVPHDGNNAPSMNNRVESPEHSEPQAIVDTGVVQGADAGTASSLHNCQQFPDDQQEGTSLSGTPRQDSPVEHVRVGTDELPCSVYSSAITGYEWDVVNVTRSGEVVNESGGVEPQNAIDASNETAVHDAVGQSGSNDARDTVDGSQRNENLDAVNDSIKKGTHNALDQSLNSPSNTAHIPPQDTERDVKAMPEESVPAAPNSPENVMTHEEMGTMSRSQCPFLMNRE